VVAWVIPWIEINWYAFVQELRQKLQECTTPTKAEKHVLQGRIGEPPLDEALGALILGQIVSWASFLEIVILGSRNFCT